MPKSKPRKLSDVIPPTAPQGSNDNKWVLVEHQLAQVKLSAMFAVQTLQDIGMNPENDAEKELALESWEIVKGLYLDILEHTAAFQSYISDSDIPERIGRKEL